MPRRSKQCSLSEKLVRAAGEKSLSQLLVPGWIRTHIAQDEGFAVNESKTRVQRPNAAQTVTGLVVNRRVGVPRATVRRLRAILHRAGREGLAAQNRDGRPHFEAWLQGMIAYVSMANAEQGRRLQSAFEELAGPWRV